MFLGKKEEGWKRGWKPPRSTGTFLANIKKYTRTIWLLGTYDTKKKTLGKYGQLGKKMATMERHPSEKKQTPLSVSRSRKNKYVS